MKALAFDLYGTLYDVNSLVEPLRERVGRGEELLTLWRSKQLQYTFLYTLMGRYKPLPQITREALVYSLARLGLELGDEEINGLVGLWLLLRPYPDTKALEELRRRLPLLILTNGDASSVKALLRRDGLLGHFAKILSADEVKAYKPSPQIYSLAPKSVGAMPDQVMLVSSNAFDILGAKAAGLKACWVNRSGEPLDPLGLEPDYIVSTLEELQGLL